MDKFDNGDTVRAWCSFRAASFTVTDGVPLPTNTLTDPTTVTLQVTTPAGSTTSYTYAANEVTKSATGVFYRDVALSSVGTWTLRWVGTGTVAAATSTTVKVV